MSILWRLIYFNRCTSTHHKLALDALRFVRGPQAQLWANLFLTNHEQYLTGSKAPDNEFRDFKNHVLHVQDGFWGGAPHLARQWYQKTVLALSQGDWPEAVYNAGVLSHYFTDPFQPFHTGQTEAEGNIHRAAEWSICKAYDELQAILEEDLNGYPELEVPTSPDWLEAMIRQGAVTAHESYQVSIDHYDLNRGIKDPVSGLDQELKDRLARLIGLASVGFARVLERAFEESAASPPDVAVSLHTILAGMKIPLNWIRKKITDLRERALIEAIYLEIQDTGKATESLPEDERLVRKLHAQEVLKVPVRYLDEQPPVPTGTKYGTGAPARSPSVEPVSPSRFQRTVVSHAPAPLQVRSSSTVLESCLMVPLAKEPPRDYVVDSVVKAFLQQSEQMARTAQQQQTTVGLQAANLIPKQADRTTGAGSTDARPRAAITPLPEPTREELDREERRLRKQQKQVREREPVVPAPAIPDLTSSLHYTASSGLDPFTEMFAPLPAVAPSKPERLQDNTGIDPAPVDLIADMVPPMAVGRQAIFGSAVAKPKFRIDEQPAETTRLIHTPAAVPLIRTQGTATSAELQQFILDPSESQVVPAPHIKLAFDEGAEPGDVESPSSATGEDVSFQSPASKPRPPVSRTPVNRLPAQTESSDTPPRITAASARPIASRETQAGPVPQAQSSPAAAIPSGVSALGISESAVTAAAQQASVASQPAARVVSDSSDSSAASGRRFYLELASPVVDAPSIGPKTAERLQAVGIRTVADLLRSDPSQAAVKLGNPAAVSVIRDWQDQARLVCSVPNLRGHDAQFLVACNVRTAQQLQSADSRRLCQQVLQYLKTSAGQRVLRGGSLPDQAEVTEWIVAARDARDCSKL